MGGKRGVVLAAERPWLLRRLVEKPDIPLRALVAELRQCCIAVSYNAVWHIIYRQAYAIKKRPARQRTRSPGRRANTSAMATASRQS